MKIFLFIIIIITCSLTSISVNAQKNTSRYSLSGKVTDTSGAPLSGASIYIADLRKGDISDANGNFQISNIPSGTYAVEVKFIGYKTILK
ncbi:MAG: carboxypeptidase-like regulatory domain-containing protein, partial [Ginsengibacter sp.]